MCIQINKIKGGTNMIVQNYNSPVAKNREEFIRKVIEMSKPIDELIKIINSFPADDNQLSAERIKKKREFTKRIYLTS